MLGHIKLTFIGNWEEVTPTINPENIERFYCAPGIEYRLNLI